MDIGTPGKKQEREVASTKVEVERSRLGICFGGANIMADQVDVGCEKRKESRMTPKFLA